MALSGGRQVACKNNGANGGGKCQHPSKYPTKSSSATGHPGAVHDFAPASPRPWGVSNCAAGAVANAITKKKRPSVIWLHFQECTGCTESLLRAEHPTLEKLILDVISLDYHETLFAAAGHQAEAARRAAMKENKGKYILVVEGAIPDQGQRHLLQDRRPDRASTC